MGAIDCRCHQPWQYKIRVYYKSWEVEEKSLWDRWNDSMLLVASYIECGFRYMVKNWGD